MIKQHYIWWVIKAVPATGAIVPALKRFIYFEATTSA